MEPKVLLVNGCCKLEVSARKSTIKHARAGNQVFASQDSEEKVVAGSYYRSPAYTDLPRELR